MDPHYYKKCFQLALKVEERNKKKQDSCIKGRGKGRDARGTYRGGYGGRTSDTRSQGMQNLVN